MTSNVDMLRAPSPRKPHRTRLLANPTGRMVLRSAEDKDFLITRTDGKPCLQLIRWTHLYWADVRGSPGHRSISQPSGRSLCAHPGHGHHRKGVCTSESVDFNHTIHCSGFGNFWRPHRVGQCSPDLLPYGVTAANTSR